MTAEERPTWAERLVRRLGRTWPLVLLFFAALFVSSVAGVAGGVVYGAQWANERFFWRDDESKTLAELRAGMSLDSFRTVLGPAIFRRPVEGSIPLLDFIPADRRRLRGGPFTESGFHRRGDTWVQTISDRNSTVVFFAITSCDEDFHPTFYAPYRMFRVILNSSTFNDVIPWSDRALVGTRAQYFLSGATANSRLMEHLYGGNPLDYKSVAFGVNDVCPGWHERNGGLGGKAVSAFGTGIPEYYGSPRARPGIREFRAGLIVNTYGETAPDALIDLDKAPFQIGVDRILIRSLRQP